MTIGGYSIDGYWWLFYECLLMTILLMAINSYSIGGYWWFRVIGGYWWLFY
jgi:hypothetical protein